MEYFTLNNGVRMPKIGYGVYQVPPEEAERCVREALEVGYRHIDTAQAYRNEEGVGTALSGCGIDRAEIFVTSKVWISNAGEERAMRSIEDSLRKLRTDYLDLMLIHQPYGDYYGTWRALVRAMKAGKLRAAGVSNFYPGRLMDLICHTDTVPQVNQVETHPFFQQPEAHSLMVKHGVLHESWGPFAEGRNDFFTNPVLTKVAAAHGRTPAQTALRFLLQQDIAVIPKSSRRERMAENFAVDGFELTAAEMHELRKLDTKKSLFIDHEAPESVEFLSGLTV